MLKSDEASVQLGGVLVENLLKGFIRRSAGGSTAADVPIVLSFC